MSGLELALVLAALLAGLTGTWSPCGFSMIETLGPTGHTGGRATTIAACVTFTLGALVGGIITFGSLAVLGEVVHGADDRLAYAIAAVIALAAAVAEVRATPIVPQIRRQLPEHWRRVLPMPVTGGLYGVLLGLGFTTFVLTLGVWALAGIAFAVGEPVTGLALGLAFGIGRALPISLVAPVADRPTGIRVTELMAGRPALYRGFRLSDGAALALVAAALLTTVPASASRLEQAPAADPSAAAEGLAFQRPDRSGFLLRAGNETALPGRDPAVGGGRIAVASGDEIVLLSAADLSEEGRFHAPSTDAIAVSSNWVAWRSRDDGDDTLRARRIDNPANPGKMKTVAAARGAAQLGRPSLDDNRLVYARATRRVNRIVARRLGKKGGSRTLRRSVTAGLSNPSIGGGQLLYVRHERRRDLLKLARVKSGEGRTLISKRRGTLWSTALSKRRAYVTAISGTGPSQKILSAKR
jgi:MFS family permease